MRKQLSFADMELMATIATKVSRKQYPSILDGLKEYGFAHLSHEYVKQLIVFGEEILGVIQKEERK